ncbi:MAG TPA: CAP domain-containing protein [Anaerolineales bacterium]
MVRSFNLLLSSLFFALILGFTPRSSQAQPYPEPVFQSGSDLLAAVNSLRASQGLSAYNTNSILMGIAQAQADYMAATGGAYGHLGPGGSSPIQRAQAAGYAAAFFSENWQSGSGLSPGGAVSAWQGDAPHLNTMLSASLVDAGAGVSKSGNVVYYVLDAGAVGQQTGGGGAPVSGTVSPAATTGPSQFMVPVSLSTPNAEGLVYHEVGYGQSLWSIAIAYGTKIEAIKALNNLADTSIQPGQKLLVLKGPTPEPATPTRTARPTKTPVRPSATPGATQVVMISPTAGLQDEASSQPAPAARRPAPARLNLTAIGIIGAALLFAILGTWLGTRKPS